MSPNCLINIIIHFFLGIIVPFVFFFPCIRSDDLIGAQKFYKVVRSEGKMIINAEWDKPEWKKVEALELNEYMGPDPQYDYKVMARLMYNDDFIYVIFKLEDKWVRCVTDSINGPVWEDSCVEFFFAPDTAHPMKYFNLEINCAGTPLMHYNVIAGKEYVNIDPEDIYKIDIAPSMPGLVNPEMIGPVTWYLEYRIPIKILRKYSNVTGPEPGDQWRANFYKIAHKSSHPHYITWSPINRKTPDFHLPEYFGVIEFE